MKKRLIGDRVLVEETETQTFLFIAGQVESWKETVILTWLIAWTACGVVVLTQLFGDMPGDQKLALWIYMAFWAYFEYKMVNSWLWRKFGTEMIKIDAEGIHIKRDVRSYGKVKTFFAENIRSVDAIEHKASSFAQVFNQSFWVIGGERIKLDYMGNDVALGMNLNDSERDQVIKLMRKLLQRYKKSED